MGYQQIPMSESRTAHTVELTFSFRDESCFFVGASNALQCRVVGLSAMQRRSGGFLEYLTVYAPADEVIAFAEGHPSVESVRVVDEFDAGCLIEAVVTGTCVAATLAESHAIVTEASADRGDGTVRAEVTSDADVRTVVERMREVHPGTELRSKCERDGNAPSALAADVLADTLLAMLTDKQRDAVRTAVMSGYLAWPRRSTASECADALGVSQPTFSQHLYRGLERLLGQLFEGRPEPGESVPA